MDERLEGYHYLSMSEQNLCSKKLGRSVTLCCIALSAVQMSHVSARANLGMRQISNLGMSVALSLARVLRDLVIHSCVCDNIHLAIL